MLAILAISNVTFMHNAERKGVSFINFSEAEFQWFFQFLPLIFFYSLQPKLFGADGVLC
jgi:hypothetical protein